MQHQKYQTLNWKQNSSKNGIKSATIYENRSGGGVKYWSIPKGLGFILHSHRGYEYITLIEGEMNFSGQVLTKGDCLITLLGDEHEAVALKDSIILVTNEKSNS